MKKSGCSKPGCSKGPKKPRKCSYHKGQGTSFLKKQSTKKESNNIEVKVSYPKNLDKVIDASIEVQKIIPNAIPTGGTVAAFYAGHRMSYDVDHLMSNLVEEIEDIDLALSKIPGWKVNKKRNAIILGKIGSIEVGFRQMFRDKPIETVTIKTPKGDWIIPTLEEITRFKAILCCKRGGYRDYMDFAALAEKIGDDGKVVSILMEVANLHSNEGDDIMLEMAKALSDPNPEDMSKVGDSYKEVSKDWSWGKIKSICEKYGKLISVKLFESKK